MFQDTQQQEPLQQTPVNQTVPEQPAPGQQQQPATPPTPPAVPPPPPVQTTQEERIWAAISYIAFLGLLTLAMVPKSTFCKRHAAHGLTIFIAWFVLIFAVLILLWPFPPLLVSLVSGLLFIGTFALSLLGIIKSLQSYELNIPLLTPLALKFPVDLIIGTLTGKPAEKTQFPQQQPPAEQPPTEQPPNSETPPKQ